LAIICSSHSYRIADRNGRKSDSARMILLLFFLLLESKVLYLLHEGQSVWDETMYALKKYQSTKLLRKAFNRDSPLSYMGIHQAFAHCQPFPGPTSPCDEYELTTLNFTNYTFAASPLVRSLDTLILTARTVFMADPKQKIQILSFLTEDQNTPESWTTTRYGKKPAWGYTSFQKESFTNSACIGETSNDHDECSLWLDKKRCEKHKCKWSRLLIVVFLKHLSFFRSTSCNSIAQHSTSNLEHPS